MRGRIRTVKPEFYQHGGLYDAEVHYGLPLRLAYEGLWNYSDREGRFEWKPRELKLNILPYDPLDFSDVLDALATRGFVVRYAIRGREYGWIPTFKDHQQINNREEPSKITPPPQELVDAVETGTYRHDSRAWTTRGGRVGDACGSREKTGEDASEDALQGEGSGRDGKESLSVPSEPSVARVEETAPAQPQPRPLDPATDTSMERGEFMALMRKTCSGRRDPITEADMKQIGSITKRMFDRGWNRQQIYRATVGWRSKIDRGDVKHIPAGSKFTLAKLYDKDPDVDQMQVGLDAYYRDIGPDPPKNDQRGGMSAIGDVDYMKRFGKANQERPSQEPPMEGAA